MEELREELRKAQEIGGEQVLRVLSDLGGKQLGDLCAVASFQDYVALAADLLHCAQKAPRVELVGLLRPAFVPTFFSAEAGCPRGSSAQPPALWVFAALAGGLREVVPLRSNNSSLTFRDVLVELFGNFLRGGWLDVAVEACCTKQQVDGSPEGFSRSWSSRCQCALPAALQEQCVSWLCALPDLLAPLADPGSDDRFLPAQSYYEALVHAVLRAAHLSYEVTTARMSHGAEFAQDVAVLVGETQAACASMPKLDQQPSDGDLSGSSGMAAHLLARLVLRGLKELVAEELLAWAERGGPPHKGGEHHVAPSDTEDAATYSSVTGRSDDFPGWVVLQVCNKDISAGALLVEASVAVVSPFFELPAPPLLGSGQNSVVVSGTTKRLRLSEGLRGPQALRTLLGPVLAKVDGNDGDVTGSTYNDGGMAMHVLATKIWNNRSIVSTMPAALAFGITDLLWEANPREFTASIFERWANAWAEPMVLKHADDAEQRLLALRMARGLALAWKALRASEAMVNGKTGSSSNSFWMSSLLRGVQLRLDAHTKGARQDGMAVAEILGQVWMPKGGDAEPLRFDDLSYDDGTCGLFTMFMSDFGESEEGEKLLQLHRVDQKEGSSGGFAELPFPSVPALEDYGQNSESTAKCGYSAEGMVPRPVSGFAVPESTRSIGIEQHAESDSDSDDDDEEDEKPQRLSSLLADAAPLEPLQGTCAENDYSDLRTYSTPLFLRDCYERLGGPPPGGKHMKMEAAPLAGLAATGNRVDETPAEATERLKEALLELPSVLLRPDSQPLLATLAEPLCRRLLFLGSGVAEEHLPNFGELRVRALADVVVSTGGREKAVRWLTSQFLRNRDISMSQRLVVLDALCQAAVGLSGRGMPEGQIEKKKEEAPEVLPPKTRRIGRAPKKIDLQTNQFSTEMRSFFLPLCRLRTPAEVANRWLQEDYLISGGLCHALGVFLECASQACPDLDAVAPVALNVVGGLGTHREPYVRRCCYFLFSRVLIVCPPGDALLGSLIESEAWKWAWAWLETAPRTESDEVGRKMAQGLLVVVSKLGTTSLTQYLNT